VKPALPGSGSDQRPLLPPVPGWLPEPVDEVPPGPLELVFEPPTPPTELGLPSERAGGAPMVVPVGAPIELSIDPPIAPLGDPTMPPPMYARSRSLLAAPLRAARRSSRIMRRCSAALMRCSGIARSVAIDRSDIPVDGVDAIGIVDGAIVVPAWLVAPPIIGVVPMVGEALDMPDEDRAAAALVALSRPLSHAASAKAAAVAVPRIFQAMRVPPC
jgi:hypothetical protein